MVFQFGTTCIAVNVRDSSTLLAHVRAKFAAGEGFSLATINLDHLVKLRRNPAFRAAYDAQDFVVADGNPIVWLSGIAGQKVDLVPGADMVIPLAEIAAQSGVSVALLGSTPEALEGAATALKAQIPGLVIAAQLSPEFGFDPTSEQADRLIEQIRESGAGLCFLALGAPTQEVFAARGCQAAPGVGFASIGAGLDFLAGSQRRAPKWMRAMALEWVFRVVNNPRRLARRYAECIVILPRYAIQALRLRRQNASD